MSENNAKKTYTMTIAGCKRELPLFKVNDNLEIAAFIMLGDVEITIKSAKKLLRKVPKFDVILTPEAKSIPLAYEMSRRSGKPYIVARKALKVYMDNPIEAEVKSITTQNVQHLYLASDEVEKLNGKRVLIIDDVISTGDSLAAVVKLAEEAGGNIVCKAAVLAEGDASKRDDIVYLEPLPLFPKE